MKSYTDLEQSRKLAEILPIESADMHYATWTILDGEFIVSINQGSTIEDLQEDYGNQIIPCWSLAALLNILPSVIKRKGKRIFLTLEKAGAYNLYYKSPDRLDELWETNEEPIDACVSIIIKLHELNLL